MTGRRLEAWWDDGTRAGEFVEIGPRQVEFRYADESRDRRPVSVALPADGEPHHPFAAFNFLDNLLPENTAIRGRLARQHGVDPNDAFGLLGAIGRECAGALILLPPGEEPPTRPGEYRPLSDATFERWYEMRDSQPLMCDAHGRVRLSLAGAQPKAALFFDAEDRPCIPIDGAPTTHIVKPPIRRARPNTMHIEWYCMQLARAMLGQEQVAEVDAWRRCLRVRRFDRLRGEHGIRRVHQEDLCQALGLAVGRKYESRGESRDFGQTLLARSARLIDRLGAEGRVAVPAIEKQTLLRHVLTNALLLNADAHLKNYALLHDDDGIHVAPMYDVVCTCSIRLREGGDGGWDDEPLHEVALDKGLPLAIGNAGQIDRIEREHWVECGQRQLGMSRRYVETQLDLFRNRLVECLRPVGESIVASDPAAERAVEAVQAELEQHYR